MTNARTIPSVANLGLLLSLFTLVLLGCDGPSGSQDASTSDADGATDVDSGAPDFDADTRGEVGADDRDALDVLADTEEADSHDREVTVLDTWNSNPIVDREYLWTDLHDRIPFAFDRVPLNPDCEDGAWNPTPSFDIEGLGANRNFDREIPAEGGLICVDGYRLWIPPIGDLGPVNGMFEVTKSVPFGSAHTWMYYAGWGWGGTPPPELRVVIDLGEISGSLPASIASAVYGKIELEIGRFEPLVIEAVVPTAFGWRIYAPWPTVIHVGRPRERDTSCGNGVLDPGELCDPGLPVVPERSRRSICYDCGQAPYEAVCDEVACYDWSILRDDCLAQRTDCWSSEPELALNVCRGRPINEGEVCAMNAPTLGDCRSESTEPCEVGVCRQGACVPQSGEPCTACSDGPLASNSGRYPARNIEGECVYAATDVRSGPSIFYDNFCTIDDWCSLRSSPGCNSDFADEQWRFQISSDWEALFVHMRYAHLYRYELPSGQLVPTERYALTAHEDWELAVPFEDRWSSYVSLPVEPFGEIGEVTMELGPFADAPILIVEEMNDIHDQCAPTGGLYVESLRTYRHESPPCHRAFEVGDEVHFCPQRPSVTDCDGTCVDLMSNRSNCGTCGVQCTGFDVCFNGECVCPPELEALNPDACDGCPTGFGRPQCDRECLGRIGEGIYCNGNGTCPDGPYGSGVCVCDDRFHGPACELSCNDGIRNGGEWNTDCGGPCGRGCGSLDNTGPPEW